MLIYPQLTQQFFLFFWRLLFFLGTPLVRAACYGHLPVVKFLTKCKDVDINAGDERNTTALIYASMKGYINIVKYLSNLKGIDLNAMDEVNFNFIILVHHTFMQLCMGI